ncbi:MAG: hypothetical protein AUG13_06925 [Chloroflexi bacterium 13_1_20CM_2_59_7]|nr:MAG: hypothetical protein AUG13_06925 [Chloroflexi bacterium 13_1_20CM_2_59_7]
MGEVAGLLVGPRESELRRGVQRIQLERTLESVNRLGKLFDLGVSGAKKIPGVSIVGVDLDYAAEGVHRALRIVRILIQQTEVEPGVRIVGITLDRLLEKLLRRLDAPQVKQRYALVQPGDLQLGVERGSVLKGLETFLEELLVHIGSAQIVEAGRFEGFIPEL